MQKHSHQLSTAQCKTRPFLIARNNSMTSDISNLRHTFEKHSTYTKHSRTLSPCPKFWKKKKLELRLVACVNGGQDLSISPSLNTHPHLSPFTLHPSPFAPQPSYPTLALNPAKASGLHLPSLPIDAANSSLSSLTCLVDDDAVTRLANGFSVPATGTFGIVTLRCGDLWCCATVASGLVVWAGAWEFALEEEEEGRAGARWG